MMLDVNHLAPIFAIFATLFTSQLNFNKLVPQQDINLRVKTPKVNIGNLADGDYQFCSQPDPQDWRVGAGVCANFHKTANQFQGYYGYPHSDNFICIRGNLKGNLVTGEALAILWDSHQQYNLPQSAFNWDVEGRLTLSQGNLISTANHQDAVKWMLYRQALLNLEGFYQYNRPRMTPPSQLCEWNF
ncbi:MULTISPECIES: hypothetical protein [unclassified Anabaena]|uniref:hypothetical protein n=1 Tax=unclassified Anabaena TaxID=2619674 RepID=UPI001E59BC15|nr:MULTISPECIES: hypothetical protein [unclassified Anabaena]